MRHIARPLPEEHAPYATEYYDLVPGDDVLAHMTACLETTPEFFRSVPDELLATRHREGEWTVCSTST